MWSWGSWLLSFCGGGWFLFLSTIEHNGMYYVARSSVPERKHLFLISASLAGAATSSDAVPPLVLITTYRSRPSVVRCFNVVFFQFFVSLKHIQVEDLWHFLHGANR